MQAIERIIGQELEQTVEPAIEPTIEAIRCPNCGSPAERYRSLRQQRIHTQCNQCDYLMTTCSLTGRVIEAYAPGIPFVTKSIETLEAARKPHPLLNL